MPKSHEALMECETTIRWDQTGELAVLWTADPAIRKIWESYGFVITPSTIGGGVTPKRTTGWRTTIPVDRISYKPLKKA